MVAIGLDRVETQYHAEDYEEEACHLEPQLVERADNATENLFQSACHVR